MSEDRKKKARAHLARRKFKDAAKSPREGIEADEQSKRLHEPQDSSYRFESPDEWPPEVPEGWKE